MRVAVGSQQAAWRRDPLPYCASVLLFLSVLFGGGGAEGPLQNGILEAGGALLLCAVAALHFRGRVLAHEAVTPVWITVAILVAILLQLVSLPPALWSALPGREAAVAVDLTINGQLNWRPLSLDPEATRRAAAALLLPVPIMLVAATASRSGLLAMIRGVLSGALTSAMLGAAQLTLGSPKNLSAYGDPVPGSAAGVFANANHHASLLLCAMILSGLLIRLVSPTVRVRTATGSLRLNLGWLLPPVLAVIVLATTSRAGLLLLVPALIAALLIATGRRKARVLILLLLGALLLAGTGLAAGSGVSDFSALQRMLHDNRLISLPDILFTFQQFWPAGSGLGTFVPVFKANENLDLVSNTYLNHAHNDVLELLIEMGLAGALLLVLGIATLLVRLWSIRRGRTDAEVMATLAGASILALLLLHSLVDYPFRADAVAAVAGLAAGLLYSRLDAVDRPGRAKPSRSRAKRGFGSPVYGGTGAGR